MVETHRLNERDPNMTDWKTLIEAEDHAYFMGELVLMSPDSFTLEEKKQILQSMEKESSEIENGLREHFRTLDEVAQTRLLDSLGASGYRNRDWWRKMLMEFPRHREKPTI